MTKELDDSVNEDSGEQHDDNEWPTIVLNAANKGREKLSKYYSKTDALRGYLFNCATILDPTQKLSVYEGETWDPADKYTYQDQFLNYCD
ncbi:hypothetical protein EJ02DRAFT_360103 [Clathrospora elynae]|uniref:hAT-like transposase RNase-H fold domain-containing protein n=1 Tax=Clathrospora elynae TaxID=706981 RepID=A0A6A5SF35_9PLEO|nr:hypothetical protein EJ02DRAFT_360103 [Clathrospora elynae]